MGKLLILNKILEAGGCSDFEIKNERWPHGHPSLLTHST